MLGLVGATQKNWVHLLVGMEPKDRTKTRIVKRQDLLLAARKENTGVSSPKQCLSKQQKGRSFKLRFHVYS